MLLPRCLLHCRQQITLHAQSSVQQHLYQISRRSLFLPPRFFLLNRPLTLLCPHTIQGLRRNTMDEACHLAIIIIGTAAAHSTDALDLVLRQDVRTHRSVHRGALLMTSIAVLGLPDGHHLQALTDVICTIMDLITLNHLITGTLDLTTDRLTSCQSFSPHSVHSELRKQSPLRDTLPPRSPLHRSQMSDLEEGQLSETDPDFSPGACSSVPARDEPVTLVEMTPPDNLKEFQDLFKRVAQSQEVQLIEDQVKQHKLFKNLHPKQQRRIALPIDDAILEVAEEMHFSSTGGHHFCMHFPLLCSFPEYSKMVMDKA
nr:uncharacterized protein LOC106731744 [Pelodiscus sinensis]|eukprot:XP_014427307.1 uncharacterized protein LOC106731744 [Pelodiscus sinensis]